jgi:hypothetical protein
MKIKSGSFSHSYDGYYIHIEDRSLTSIMTEKLGDQIWNVVDPCGRKIWQIRYSKKLDEDGLPKTLETPLYALCSTVSNVLWRIGRKENKIAYPVTDEWAEETFPGDWAYAGDHVRDPNWAKDKCPHCLVGVLNQPNLESVAKRGMCLTCFIDEGHYGGI